MRARLAHKLTVGAWALLSWTAAAGAARVLFPLGELVATLHRSALPALAVVVVGLVLIIAGARGARGGGVCSAHHNPAAAPVGELERWQAATAVAVLAASVGGADPVAVAASIQEARSDARFAGGADAVAELLGRAGNEWSGASGVAWAWSVLDALGTPGVGAGLREAR